MTITNFLFPPLGTIILTLCYFKFLKVVPALLLFIHFSMTSFCIASLLFINSSAFFTFGIIALPIFGQFGGITIVALIMDLYIEPIYDEKMIIF